MFCSKCGTSNDDTNKFCQNCGANLQPVVNENQQVVSNNVKQNTNNNTNAQMPSFSSGHSIFLIIFSLLCCGGVIGVVFAVLSLTEGNKVNDYAATGDLENALRCKKNANKWIKATYITWAVVAALMILYFAFMIFVSVIAEM